MKKSFVVFVIFMQVIMSSYAMYRTTEGARSYLWTFSPELMGLGMGFAGNESPSSFVINPASNSFLQRIELEVSYGVAPGFLASTFNNSEKFSETKDFFMPFIINTSVSIPTKYANFTLAMHYNNSSNYAFKNISSFNSNNNDLGLGKTGTVYFGVSKDFLSVFGFGFSGNLKFSYNPDSFYSENKFDVGFGFDIGAVYRPDVRFPFIKNTRTDWAFQDLEVALVLKDIGKPLINTVKGNSETYNGITDIHWFPALPTIATGVSFNLYNNGVTYWKVLFDASFPFFQNVTIAAGTEIEIFNFFTIRGSYTFDLEGTLEYAGKINQYEYLYNIFNFSGGISFKFTANSFKLLSKDKVKENSFKNTEFSIDLGFKPYHQGFMFMAGCTITIGSKDVTPPVIKHRQKDYFISPNFDGIKDVIDIELEISDERYITDWSFEVYNSNGSLVRLIEGRQPRLETIKPADALKIFLKPKTGIPIPSKVIWDGKDDKGAVVPDGEYTFKFYAVDDNKNKDEQGSLSGYIIVDTTAPKVDYKVNDYIFSPDGDGNKDLFIIELEIIRSEVTPLFETLDGSFELEGSDVEILKEIDYIEISSSVNNSTVTGFDKITREQKWFVDILSSSDQLVKRYEYNEKGKKRIEWDGKGEDGVQVPDGVYRILLWSISDAGNRWEKPINNIIIDTIQRPIKANLIDLYFSPNGDTVKDKVRFRFDIPVTEGIERWKVEILDQKNQTVKIIENAGVPPTQLEWDGLDKVSKIAAEGSYRAQLTAFYRNGSMPQSITPEFYLDVTAPFSEITLSSKIFSPDGDGNLDDVTVSHNKSSEEDEWNGRLFNKDGNIVRSFIWRGKPPQKFIWNGVDNNGNLLDDGVYFYQLSSVDKAGNRFISETFSVNDLVNFKNSLRIDTKDVPIFLTVALDDFSPNKDSVKDIQVFTVRANVTDNKVVKWNFNIKNFDSEQVVYRTDKTGDLPKRIEWDGEHSSKIASDGAYYGELVVEFENGSKTNTKSKSFILDNRAPVIETSIISRLFSPNNDGFLDKAEILQRGTKEDVWESIVYDSKNSIVFSSFLKDSEPSGKFIWDGVDNNGNSMPNGVYRYEIKSTDRAGNTGRAEEMVELKNVRTNLFLTLDKTGFAPNNSGAFDSITIKSTLSEKTGVIAYNFEILDADKKVVYRSEAENKVPTDFIWDGNNEKGSKLQDGIYSSRLTVVYDYGNRPVAESSTFILDTTPPEVKLAYNPDIFSPDDDGVDDELSISINASDLSGIRDWSMKIMNPSKSKTFYEYSGKGAPSKNITWKGRSLDGELVESAEDYPVIISFVDVLGNSIVKEMAPIPVDILVIKLDDGRLKIKISNIEFKADSHEMTDSDKNMKIIKLLARSLRKYSQYDVIIEGHANKFREGLDEVRAKTLSLQRSDFIKEILSKNGIARNRLTAEGKGFDLPLVPLTQGVSSDELAKNRRVEFYLNRK